MVNVKVYYYHVGKCDRVLYFPILLCKTTRVQSHLQKSLNNVMKMYIKSIRFCSGLVHKIENHEGFSLGWVVWEE